MKEIRRRDHEKRPFQVPEPKQVLYTASQSHEAREPAQKTSAPFPGICMHPRVRKILHEWKWPAESLCINEEIKDSLPAGMSSLIPEIKIC